MQSMSPCSPPRSAACGFTLVEVLVALGVMALLSVLSWQGIDTLLRSREITYLRVGEVALMQSSLRQWQMDLDAMQTFPDLLPEGSLSWDGRVMRVLRRSATPTSSGTDGGVHVVAWTLREGHWYRWQSTGLQTRSQVRQAWQAASQWGHHPDSEWRRQETRLMPAQSWQLLYCRGHTWTDPQSSREPNPRIPDAVRIELQLQPPVADTDPLVLTVDWVNPVFNPNRT